MTLLEMSVVYAEHAAVIRSRIVELRGLTRQETDLSAILFLRAAWGLSGRIMKRWEISLSTR